MECGKHAELENCRGLSVPCKKPTGVGPQSNLNSSLGRQRGDYPVGPSLGSVEAEVGCELGGGGGESLLALPRQG